MVMLGRRSQVDGVRRDRMAPSKRGFHTITVSDPVFTALIAYMNLHRLPSKPAAIAHLLARLKPAQE